MMVSPRPGPQMTARDPRRDGLNGYLQTSEQMNRTMSSFNIEKFWRFAFLLTSTSLVACQSRSGGPAPAPSASAVFDRNANGKLLQQSLAQWSKRWAEVQPLPDCGPLLGVAPSLELCKQAIVQMFAT